MSRISNHITSVVDTATTMTKNQLYVCNTIIDIREAISGVIEIGYQVLSNAAGDSIDLYLLYSIDGVNFDTSSVSTPIAALSVPDANLNQLTIPLDAGAVSGQYAKIALLPNLESDDLIVNSLKISLKKIM